MRQRQYTTQQGMTVIEMVVTISVFVIIMTAIATSVIQLYRANAFNIQQAIAITNGRRSIEQTIRDIREMTFSDSGTHAIESLAADELIFHSDVDRDASIERIRFFLDGTDLKRGLTNATGSPPMYATTTEENITTVASFIRNNEEIPTSIPVFRYFNKDGTEITDYDDFGQIGTIRVTFIVNVSTIRKPNEFTVRSTASLRNIADL